MVTVCGVVFNSVFCFPLASQLPLNSLSLVTIFFRFSSPPPPPPPSSLFSHVSLVTGAVHIAERSRGWEGLYHNLTRKPFVLALEERRWTISKDAMTAFPIFLGRKGCECVCGGRGRLLLLP